MKYKYKVNGKDIETEVFLFDVIKIISGSGQVIIGKIYGRFMTENRFIYEAWYDSLKPYDNPDKENLWEMTVEKLSETNSIITVLQQ